MPGGIGLNLVDSRYDKKIVGLLCNSQNKYKYSHFRELMRHSLKEGLGIIYLCNNIKEYKYVFNHFRDILGDEFEETMKKKQIIISYGREGFENDGFIGNNFCEYLLSEIKEMKDNSFEISRIYINVDSGINNMSKKDLDKMFGILLYISEEYDTKVIFRFFMDEITDFYFFSIMSEIGYFVVEDISQEDFLVKYFSKIVTSSNIFLDSMFKENIEQHNPIIRHNNISCDELDQIIDEVSHDLKNIFATISGYCQLAMAKTKSNEIKDYLGIILNNSLDIHTIFERFNSKCTDPNVNKSVYSFNSLVMDASEMGFNMKRNNLNTCDSQVSISYSLNSQKDIFCDKCQIQQVIMNIIDNGIHALDDKGTIIINTYDNMNTAVLEILDNGNGIDDITIKKIFQPYFTTKKDLGMGLGLNIAKKVLDGHGATISVDSRIGVGTKFTIVFPEVDRELSLDNEEVNIYNSI